MGIGARAAFTRVAGVAFGFLVPAVAVPVDFVEEVFADVDVELLGPLAPGETNTIAGQLPGTDTDTYVFEVAPGNQVVSVVIEFSTDVGDSVLCVDVPTADFQVSTTSTELPRTLDLPILLGPGQHEIVLAHDPSVLEQVASYRIELEVGIVDDNQAPDCSAAVLSSERCWPPNHEFTLVEVIGVVDPDGDPVSIFVTDVTQDEPVLSRGRGSGRTCPDAMLVDLDGDGAPDSAALRCERDGVGDGRVYTVWFIATDPNDASCEGSATLCVPHDRRPGGDCVHDGPHFDSTVCSPRRR